MQPSKDEIGRRLAPLFADKALDLVVLFGSCAGGGPRKGSDIDLGFLFDRSTDVVDLTNRVAGMLGNDNVDVVDLRRASPLLMYAAAQKGIALYERKPGSFTRFYSLAYRMYVDTKKLRRARDQGIERFLQTREHE